MSQEQDHLLDLVQKDIERHLVMKGHPPTGAIIPPRPKEEIERRIRELRERQAEFNKLVESRKKAIQDKASSQTS